ncbi:MAG: sensor histidine kinase [Methylococcales bacterium]
MNHQTTSISLPKSSDLIPDFCSARAVLIALLLAELLALILTLADDVSDQNFWMTVGLNSFFIIWVILPSQALLCLAHNSLNKLPTWFAVGTAFVIIQLITWAVTWVSYTEFSYYALIQTNNDTLPPVYLRNLGISSIVSLILFYHLCLQSRWKQQVQAELDARLQALQSRIQPHFLFNSLNTIASTVHSNPDLAETLLVHMSELMRAGLNTQKALVTLTDELRLVHSYLNIESQRVGDRLNIEWNVDKSVRNARIPPLTLQPLVENAVYHGIEPSVTGGTVQITATKRERSVILMVRNSVSKNKQEESLNKGHGIALDNVMARVQGWFGEEGKVVFSTVDGWFQARIIIPYVSSSE